MGRGGTGRQGAGAAAAPSQSRGEFSQEKFASEFEDAFDKTPDWKGGGDRLVADLREQLPQYSREEFDRGIKQLWRDRKFTLDSSEGGFDFARTDSKAREGALVMPKPGSKIGEKDVLVFVSRR